MIAPVPTTDVDPFDLPDWLGELDVTWASERGVRGGHLVTGTLRVRYGAEQKADDLPCDLLAVDEAYPAPVADDDLRTRAHLAWRHGQVLPVERAGRLTLACPGRSFTADMVLDAVGRLARAVGAQPENWAARLRIAADRPRWEGTEH